MPSKSKLDQKTIEIQHLDQATQSILLKIDINDRRLRLSAYAFMSLLLIIGIAGIFYQNHLATESKRHIDCIIKLSETPIPKDAHSRYIAINTINNTCQIKFNK